jgi:hypothetical protein
LFVTDLASSVRTLDDPTLQKPTVTSGEGIDFRNGTVRKEMPGIERTGSRLWLTWRTRQRYHLSAQPGEVGDLPGSAVYLVYSDNDGRDWTAALSIRPSVARVSDYASCLWTDPLGRLWLFWTQGLLDGGREGVWCMFNADPRREPAAWSPPRRLCDGMMANKPTATTAGDWLLPVNFARDLGGPKLLMACCHVHRSSDQGGTFQRISTFDVPQGSHLEHMIVERRDGTLMMFIRVGGEIRPAEHHPIGIAQSLSRDRGQTWSNVVMTDIASPSSRFHVRRLPSGRVLIINHRGFDAKATGVAGRTHMTASLSDDDGATWSSHLLLHGIPPERAAQPDATVSSDGVIDVVHGHTDAAGQRHLVLHRIRESDIQAGRLVEPDSFLGRVLQ